MAAKILIAAGGTAGHVVPALAVADELRARGAEVTFAGTSDRAEAQLVPAAGYPLDTFQVDYIERKLSPRAVRALLLAGRAPFSCVGILRRRRPDAVLGGGGFVSGPMLAAARSLRIPSALTEYDAHLGLANRLAERFARRVFLAYPQPGRSEPRSRVVGRPVAQRFFETTRAEARAALELDERAFVLAVFGAYSGARRLNDAAAAAYGDGSFDGVVLHLTGERELDAVRERVSADAERYRSLAVTDRFDRVLAAADLCVARAGGSVFELAAAGAPAILVPYPYATGDHQRLNAEHFVRAGGAVLVGDAELDGPRLAREVAALRADGGRLERMSAAMRSQARPDAAREIAEGVLALAERA